MTNDCKTCPVSTGTHKPAEAVHQIDEPQAEALRLAQYLEQFRSFSDDLSAAAELRSQHARIAELEQRLEIDPRHRYDGISARDATIEAQDERIAELESQLEAIGAGGVEPLRKGFVRLTDVLARLKQGFGANSAPVTTIKRHFEMQAAPAHPAEGVPAQAGPVGYVALAALTSRTHADDYAKCFATEAALLENYPAAKAIAVFDHAATQPAAQGLDARDAARYRWLRNESWACYNLAKGKPEVALVAVVRDGACNVKMVLAEDAMDTAVDAALAAQAKEGGA